MNMLRISLSQGAPDLRLQLTARTLTRWRRYLLGFMLLELFLGGAGRLLEITPSLTFRTLVFFSTFAGTMAYLALRGSVSRIALQVAGAMAVALLSWGVLGMINDAIPANLYEDVKPLSFLLVILFFSVAIRTVEDVSLVARLLRFCSLLLALFHILLMVFLLLNVYDYQQLWTFLSVTIFNDSTGIGLGGNEFHFKGTYGLVFYKGDVYMSIGFLFWQYTLPPSWKRTLGLLIVATGIVLTGTRGFIVMLGLVYAFDWLGKKHRPFMFALALIGMAGLAVGYLVLKQYIGDKDASDAIRYLQIEQVIEEVSIMSTLIGHGFGNGVPIRPQHMEIAYLEIFHKQGLLGLAFWGYLLRQVYCLSAGAGATGRPYWLAILFVFLLSFTNPYLNHPLGLTLLALSFVCLPLLAKNPTETAP